MASIPTSQKIFHTGCIPSRRGVVKSSSSPFFGSPAVAPCHTVTGRGADRRRGDGDSSVAFAELLDLTYSPSFSSVVSPRASLRVAYQGVPGAYSEAAAHLAYPNCTPVPCGQFDDAFQAVETWMADRAVLPVENSLGGSIHRTYDLLLRHRLHIVGECQLAVRHCLMALPGTKLGDLTRVMSHPQALAQVEGNITRLGPQVVREAVDDTAGAAKLVAEQRLVNVAAVASERAAEIYGLEILKRDIQDDSDNITRFLALSREPVKPNCDRPYKTSIVFTLGKGAGVLFKALSVFALRDINLTKIESRPHRDKPLRNEWMDAGPNASSVLKASETAEYQLFDYLFYVDFQASLADVRAQNALRHLQEIAPFLRVLGSYPMDVSLQLTEASH